MLCPSGPQWCSVTHRAGGDPTHSGQMDSLSPLLSARISFSETEEKAALASEPVLGSGSPDDLQHTFWVIFPFFHMISFSLCLLVPAGSASVDIMPFLLLASSVVTDYICGSYPY